MSIETWKVQDRRMWNPEIGVWTAYIKTGDNVITIPVIAEDEQEAIDRAEQIVKCVNGYEAMREALEEIAEGKGAYSLEPLKHASNCIENMKQIAKQALKESQ